MDAHPTSFPGSKGLSVKSKYKKISQLPKHKPKDVPVQTHRRTFGTIRNHNLINIPEKTLPQKPKPKPKPSSHIPQVQPKTTQNESNEKPELINKKTVCIPEKNEVPVKKKTPAKEIDGIKTPVRPPFCVKPGTTPGTPYLSAEKCSGCGFDRMETASYWVGQIKSAESVGKHFVAAAFFRLAGECKAEPVRNLRIELRRYLTRHDDLSTMIEWEDVTRFYGKLKKEEGINNDDEKMSCLSEKTVMRSGSKLEDFEVVQKQKIENENGSGEIEK